MKIQQFVFTSILITLFSSCEKETIIPAGEIPNEINAYVLKHFPTSSITQILVDKDLVSKTFEVIITGGVSLEFNNKKQIQDIDGSSLLPESVIPEKIRQYVTSNYPNNVITDWELQGKNQQIGLNSGVELKFNLKGDFLRID
jgi:hypothetical protein